VTRNPPKLAASLFCVFRKSSGSLAILAAIRRASSLLSLGSRFSGVPFGVILEGAGHGEGRGKTDAT
jgi:hypothetical protein